MIYKTKSTFVDRFTFLATLRGMDSYRFLDHTGDLGLEVSGSTFKDILVTTARVIFDVQIEGKCVQKRSVSISCDSDSLEDLLVDWCRELLYHFSVDGFIPITYRIEHKAMRLSAHIVGDVLDTKRHAVKTEIKNVTYHNLSVEKTAAGYRATVVFDV